MSGNERTSMPESPFRTGTPSRMPSAFGEKTYVSKEEHEKERSRWLGKMEEVEKRLMDAETLNSSLTINKAELKKKIVDMEKGQRPMIDANRKLSDRNKVLQQEVKKVEQRFSHSRDDFLTLKDIHERLLKENACLKEKRVSPEKLEELSRYRNKVLEYSKCITALRSSAYEKDKRYEMLVQKFKRLQKCLKKSENDDDRMSNGGSDCSAASTVSLDTITEDFEEVFAKDIETDYQALYRENAELQRALNELQLNTSDLSEESFLRDQISFANSTIEQQQLVIDATQDMDTIAAKQSTFESEKTQLLKELDEVKKAHANQLKSIALIKKELEDHKAAAPSVKPTLSESEQVDALQQKFEKAEAANVSINEELRSASKELGKIRFQMQGKESDLSRERKMTEALSAQLQSVVSSSQEEALKKEEELKKLKATVELQQAEIEKMHEDKKEADQKFKNLEKEYAAYRDEQRPEIKTELERRYEEAKYRLKNALEKIHDYELLYEAAKKSENDGSISKHLEEELIEVKEFNAHLERQFQSQSDIIEALKKKLLQHRSFCDKINKLSELEDASRIQEELVMFSRENNCDEGKIAANIALIIKDIRKNTFYSPLEISTAHHKIRPYSSVDSSAEWQSNSSEGIVSPDEHDE
ncbi:JAKMIP_CC3 domain-containing protein [Caenorhabditis elegans]|uniref:JAKMIP_CC3 domain-containing protein n=1 Tax=Caenorhabditis elegans TaxID=6239 RepID=A0A4V0ILK2_CAEEL|nr:JAKMIP_CC3 domain-containing protein [Caenorhabditis elegans]VTW47445.1 JAKMIP_CC3 domain-containing protein [Caenorhabditis elegans]